MDVVTDNEDGTRTIASVFVNADSKIAWKNPSKIYQYCHSDSLQMLSWDDTYRTFLSSEPLKAVVWSDPLSPQVNILANKKNFEVDGGMQIRYYYQTFYYQISDNVLVDVPFISVYDQNYILLYKRSAGYYLDKGLGPSDRDDVDNEYCFGPILIIERVSKKDIPFVARIKLGKAQNKRYSGPYQ